MCSSALQAAECAADSAAQLHKVQRSAAQSAVSAADLQCLLQVFLHNLQVIAAVRCTLHTPPGLIL
jgi:hypothetical protein